MPKVAVACDDGCLRFFTAEVGVPGLQYESCLPPLDGRLLCSAWHPEGSVLVTGTSRGTLHAWEVASRHELLRLHTGDAATQAGQPGRPHHRSTIAHSVSGSAICILQIDCTSLRSNSTLSCTASQPIRAVFS